MTLKRGWLRVERRREAVCGMGALPSEELIISKVDDPEERLAEGLSKE
jgi:hypothetical protein